MRRRVCLTKSGNIVVARGWQIQPTLLEAGVKAVFSGSAQGWMFDAHRLSDVEAFLASRNIPFTLTDEDREPVAINERFPSYFEGLDFKTSRDIVFLALRNANGTEVTEVDVRAAIAQLSTPEPEPTQPQRPKLRLVEDGALW
ncbi:MAG TPA: hypothetical protein PLZ93_01145 [Nocardioides sp.]|uniref:hypothetical protein n=1 Tax=uncultured Nocardioides sp. TaxID=198441 RepID=UPI002637AE1F|nr:hypothetical protein [uncultured Nocardioides sp.]HRD60940.1 hypothetical protein [Nocardioides sp.]HRI94198.1 hypothetical protein [Nocardioides sp.]HRK44164.1 hypothetical protein [Nocardioides sp.]